jgi:PAS domain S-box-containing protein
MPFSPSRFTVLVVDDDPISRGAFSVALGSAGYDVQTASGGALALDLVRASPPSLILLDVHMPDMDGYEVCRRLRSEPALNSIPIIFITTANDAGAENKAFEVGADDYVSKPINRVVLLARAKNLLARELKSKGLEGQFQNLVQSTPVVLLFAHERHGIVTANLTAARKFGYGEIDDVMGLPLGALIPSYRQYLPAAVQPLKLGKVGPVNSVEISCRNKDGREFFVSATFSRVMSVIGELVMVALHDLTEKRQMLSDLGASRSLIRELAARNEAARELERKHIARDVHDELGQVLSALRMDVFMLRRDYQQVMPDLGCKLSHMRDLVDRAIADVRSISTNLRPAALDMGLFAAIDWLKDEFVQRTNVRCDLIFECPDMKLDELRSAVLYRIIQESLNNTAKYARATSVKLAIHSSDGSVQVVIQDDGIGFDAQEAMTRKTYGILGMHERALVLDGHLSVSSQSECGTRIELSFPVAAPVLRSSS